MGIIVGGPTTRIFDPTILKALIADRATRLWRTSPMIVTVRPSSVFFRSRIVKRSRRACVGCSWAPSPALITARVRRFARKAGAPAQGWRTTIRSACIASMFLAVSRSVSPFAALLPAVEMFTTSAESRLAASSNEVRVRVLGS